jgi:leucyl aminopeptidase
MIRKLNKAKPGDNLILIVSDTGKLKPEFLNEKEIEYATKQILANKKELVGFDRLGKWIFVQHIKEEQDFYKRLENCRKAGDKIAAKLNDQKMKKVVVVDREGLRDETIAVAEGMELGNYQFLKYKSDKKEKQNSLSAIGILSKAVKRRQVDVMNIAVDATFRCRTLVNEPASYLNAVTLSDELRAMAQAVGIKIEVLNKKKIESLKMGGLLAVNRGSIDPPTFTIMEWKPVKPSNKQPVVLVGKGIVIDTGGLNIKTGNFMETMKCDMSGAAMMGSVMYAVAKSRLPLWVVALIPATDNRPDGNAYAPGDVVTMFNGTRVEVLNTDAEGRMILGDALSYAKKYRPLLVINAATLTGAAARAIGKYGIVAMESRAAREMQALKESGFRVYERIAEFPFWDDYAELIKSEVADIKNTGGTDAGMITAGKFLEHFTDYPFIHLDIAGPAFIEKKDSYRPAGGTGIGVRLLFDYLRTMASTRGKKR